MKQSKKKRLDPHTLRYVVRMIEVVLRAGGGVTTAAEVRRQLRDLVQREEARRG